MPDLDVAAPDAMGRVDTILVSVAPPDGPAIAGALRDRGFAVIEASLQLLRAQALGVAPQVMIVDVDTPGALDAIELAREAFPRAEVLCVGDAARSAELGFASEDGRAFGRPVDVDAIMLAALALAEPAIDMARLASMPARAPDPAPDPRQPETSPPPGRHPSEAPPSEYPSTSDPLEVAAILPAFDDPEDFGGVAAIDVSPELMQILEAAEHRVSASGVAHTSSIPAPDGEPDQILPAELLASLDEPLDPEDEPSGTGGTGGSGPITGTGIAKQRTGETTPPPTAAGSIASLSEGLGRPKGEGDRATMAQTAAGRTIVPSVKPPPEDADAGRPAALALVARARGAAEAFDAPVARARATADAIDVGAHTSPDAFDTSAGRVRTSPDAYDGSLARARSTAEAVEAPAPRAREATEAPAPRAPAALGSAPRLDRDDAPPPPSAPAPAQGHDLALPAALGPGEAPRALALAIAMRASGALALGQEPAVRRIVLREGDVVTAASSSPDEALVAFLAARGDLERDAAARLAGKLPAFGRHAGAALIAHGHLGQDDLWPVLRAHAEWIIGRALLCEEGTCELEAEPPGRLKAEPNVFGGATGAEVMLESIRRVIPPDVALQRLGGPSARLAQGQRQQLLAECALSPEDEVLVRGAAGRSLGELLAASSPELSDVLYGLTLLGVLEALAPARKAPAASDSFDPLDAEAVRARVRARVALVEDGDYFALLGVPHNATAYEIRRAYVELRRTFEPSRVLTAATADLASDVRLVVEVLDEAYDILREPHRRERYRRAIEAGPP